MQLIKTSDSSFMAEARFEEEADDSVSQGKKSKKKNHSDPDAYHR